MENRYHLLPRTVINEDRKYSWSVYETIDKKFSLWWHTVHITKTTPILKQSSVVFIWRCISLRNQTLIYIIAIEETAIYNKSVVCVLTVDLSEDPWRRQDDTIAFSPKYRIVFYITTQNISLRWRHNGRDSVSNHQPHDCLLNRLFRRRSKKTSKLRVTGLCAGNSPETGEFPAQMASYVENFSIWWRHHVEGQAPVRLIWDVGDICICTATFWKVISLSKHIKS